MLAYAANREVAGKRPSSPPAMLLIVSAHIALIALAMSAKVEGAVWVEAVVGSDGNVSRVRLVRSIYHRTGLDDEALAAAKRWRFKPGTKDGQPVAMAVIIELTFTRK